LGAKKGVRGFPIRYELSKVLDMNPLRAHPIIRSLRSGLDMRTTAAIASLLTLAACTHTATMTPLNPVAVQLGAPRLTFPETASDHGPVIVAMPDGELLLGSFQVLEVAFLASGTGNFFVSATGPRTILACQGNTSFGHGGGVCRTPTGAEYQVMF
jgi:hypothetical protein